MSRWHFCFKTSNYWHDPFPQGSSPKKKLWHWSLLPVQSKQVGQGERMFKIRLGKSNYIRHNVQVAWKQLTWGTPTLQALIQRFSWTNQVGTATNLSQFTVSFIPLVSCLPKTFRSMRDCSACKSNLRGRAALGRLPATGWKMTR